MSPLAELQRISNVLCLFASFKEYCSHLGAMTPKFDREFSLVVGLMSIVHVHVNLEIIYILWFIFILRSSSRIVNFHRKNGYCTQKLVEFRQQSVVDIKISVAKLYGIVQRRTTSPIPTDRQTFPVLYAPLLRRSMRILSSSVPVGQY